MPSEPLRRSKEAVHDIERWDQQAGLSKKQRRLKLEHVAGKAGSLEDAYPFLQMHVDLRNGPYGQAFQLRPGMRSPEAEIVNDPHLTNFGIAPGPDGELVYRLIDGSKAGRGYIEDDAKRLDSTTVIVAREKKLPEAEAQAINQAIADAYFAELLAYAKSGVRPPPCVRRSELDASSPLQALFPKAEKKEAMSAVVEKLTGAPDGARFDKSVRLDDAHRRQLAERSFGKFVKRMPGMGPGSVKLLDVGTKMSVGGSNSGMVHYLFLADVRRPGGKTERMVFEAKQIVPNPSLHKSGDPSLASGKKTVRAIEILTGNKDPMMGYMKVGDVRYLVEPAEPQVTLDPGALKAKELLIASQETGKLLARTHAQSVGLPALRAWLTGMNLSDAEARLSAFSALYPQQSKIDAKGVKRRIEH